MKFLQNLNLRFLVPLLLFLIIAVFLGIGLGLNPKYLPSTMIGKPAPAFTLALLDSPQQQLSPSDLQGQRWLLNVWASWCVSCRYEHPLFNELAKKTNIVMVGLNYKDQPDAAKQWLLQRGDPYTKTVMDISGDAGIDWGVYGVPETFVIDERGYVIYKHAGPITADILNSEILPLFPSAQL